VLGFVIYSKLKLQELFSTEWDKIQWFRTYESWPTSVYPEIYIVGI